MKWLVGLVVLAQAPFLLIMFFMAGTDGRASSQLKIWAFVVPVALSGIYALYRMLQPTWPTRLDWIVTGIACAPVVLLLIMIVRKLVVGS